MTTRRRIVLFVFGALALAGAYDAVRNLPVLSGCYFYSECPPAQAAVAAHPSADRSR